MFSQVKTFSRAWVNDEDLVNGYALWVRVDLDCRNITLSKSGLKINSEIGSVLVNKCRPKFDLCERNGMFCGDAYIDLSHQ